MLSKYEKLMKKCLVLAKQGEGKVSPNPLVGAIIFDDDFNIISKGCHAKYGENHAERNAILNTNCNLKGKSLIVNLEPCSHYGKTPPCADLIIQRGIKKVIIGMIDPNPIVSGNGIKKLKQAGIEVLTGILEDECKILNEIFIKNQTQNLPFITIKTATTLDGKIATKTGNSKWITDEFSRNEVQKLRNKYDAILTSSSTVLIDNPSLTCRLKNGKNPIRIIIDTNLKTSPEANVYKNDGTKVIIITTENRKNHDNIKYIQCPSKNSMIDLAQAVKLLYNEGIKSILVEAGAKLNNAFIQENIADKLIQFIAPKILSDNTAFSFSEGCSRKNILECNDLKLLSTKKLKSDIMVVGYFCKNKKFWV